MDQLEFMEYFWGGTEEEGVAVVKPWNEQTVNEMAVESVVREGRRRLLLQR